MRDRIRNRARDRARARALCTVRVSGQLPSAAGVCI